MFMCECVSACVRVCVGLFVRVSVYVRACVRAYIGVCVCVFARVCARARTNVQECKLNQSLFTYSLSSKSDRFGVSYTDHPAILQPTLPGGLRQFTLPVKEAGVTPAENN